MNKMKKGLITFLLLIVIGIGMDSEIRAGEAEERLATFMSQYQQDYKKLYCDVSYTWWDSMILGTSESFEKASAASLEMAKYHSNPKKYEELKNLRAQATEASSLEQRADYMAEREFEQNQIPEVLNQKIIELSSEIEQLFQNQRAVYQGKTYTNNELLELLEKETRSQERYEIWDALKQVGELVAPKVIELAKLRNEAAQKLGYKNYWEMTVSFQDFSPEELVHIFTDLEEQTRPLFEEIKEELDSELKEKFSVDCIMPWHYDNPFFQQAPPSAKINLNEFYSDLKGQDIVDISIRYYQTLGFDVSSIIENSDLFEKEGKSQHGFCNNMNLEGDVRILCNIKPDVEWMDTQLHELGHAIYDFNVDRTLPYNLRCANHIFTTEGVAQYFGALARNPEWLVNNRGVSPEKANAIKNDLLEQRLREQLIFCRWTIVMTFFEKALYEDPEQDLNSLWHSMTQKYQLLEIQPNRNKADWASKPHFVIAPVYYHNYMLGELFGSQLRKSLMQESNGDPKKFGKLLDERVFKPGASSRWEDFVKDATGEELSVDAFIDELKSAKSLLN